MKLPVFIEPAARSELDERLAQLSLVNPTAPGRLRNDVASLLDLIREFPEIYECYDANLRRAVLPRWSLGLFYEPTRWQHSLLHFSTSVAIRLPSAVGWGYTRILQLMIQALARAPYDDRTFHTDRATFLTSCGTTMAHRNSHGRRCDGA